MRSGVAAPNYVAEFNLARIHMVEKRYAKAGAHLTILDHWLTEGEPSESLLKHGLPAHPNHRPMWVRVRYNLVANRIHQLISEGVENPQGHPEIKVSVPQLHEMLRAVSQWADTAGDQPGTKRFMKSMRMPLAELIRAIDPHAGPGYMPGESRSPRGLYNAACRQAGDGAFGDAIESLEKALTRRPDLKAWARQDPSLNPLRDRPQCADVLDRLISGDLEADKVGDRAVADLDFLKPTVVEALASYGVTTLQELADLSDSPRELARLARHAGLSRQLLGSSAQIARNATDLGGVRYALLMEAAGFTSPGDVPGDPAKARQMLEEANAKTEDRPIVSPRILTDELISSWRRGRVHTWQDEC